MKTRNLTVFLLLVMSLPVVCFAQQEISGLQSGILGPGDYTVVGDIEVESGTSLTIVSGTTFNHDGNYKWNIYGAFTAAGAENDSIYFICDSNNGWGGLRFRYAAPVAVLNYCVVDNCHLEYSTVYFAAINVTAGMGLTLTHSRISNNQSDNYSSGVYVVNSVAFIDNCRIINNSVGWYTKGLGIFLKDSADSQILNSVIAYNNSSDGL